jgi:hypothetical protein
VRQFQLISKVRLGLKYLSQQNGLAYYGNEQIV